MAALVIAVVAAAPATAREHPARVAALQSALKQLHLYSGLVDGVRGPLTRHGIVAFQRRRGLHVDGIAGPRTRRALGWRGGPGLGSRVMRPGTGAGTSPRSSSCSSAPVTAPVGPTACSGR